MFDICSLFSLLTVLQPYNLKRSSKSHQTNRIMLATSEANIYGITLRFLQKIFKNAELLGPSILICRSCLEHHHSFVHTSLMYALSTVSLGTLFSTYANLPGGRVALCPSVVHLRSSKPDCYRCLRRSNGYWAVYDQIFGLDASWMSCCKWSLLRWYGWVATIAGALGE